ncbi:MAG: PIN domain-containing protein [Candidatus Limnocylindrales bacterium]
MICIDTSVIIRYLVGRPDAQARRAAAVIEGSEMVAVSVVSIVETAHVLRTEYEVARKDIVDALIDLARRENVFVLGMDHDNVIDALVRARAMPGRPILDALIAIGARGAGALPLVTFDRQMSRYGVPTREP